jgi:hypothetical protein
LSTVPQDPGKDAAALRAELEAVKLREASFRAKMVQEFLDRGERNTYLHTLREERAALVKRLQEASADLEVLTRKLEAGGAGAEPNPQKPPVEGAVFTYYLHTSPFRIYRDAAFTLRGWAWPQDGRAVTQVRANVGGRLFAGRAGLEEPEVLARHGAQERNPRPGFAVTFDTPPGRHLLSLEAQLDGAEWRSIMTTSIWCEPAAR